MISWIMDGRHVQWLLNDHKFTRMDKYKEKYGKINCWEIFFIETSMNGLIIHFMMVHVTIVLETSLDSAYMLNSFMSVVPT